MPYAIHFHVSELFQDLQRSSDLIGPYRGTYRIVYRVLQPLLGHLPTWRPLHPRPESFDLGRGRQLWCYRRTSEGVGADLLSQLGSDAWAMAQGKLLPSKNREVGNGRKRVLLGG